MKTGAALFFATLVCFGSLARLHPYGTYGTETDFYHLYAPDADRIASGQFPANTFQGPGYPLLLSLFPDRFTGGKIISVVSGAAVVLLAFLLFGKLFGYGAGVGAAVLVAVSGRFAEYAISATTDVFFLALSLLVLVLLTRDRIALAGLAAGLAFLTRYNAVALVVAAVLVLALRREWKRAAIFVALFLVVALPWLIVAPPNTNYLNIATRFYPELAGGRTDQDATRVLATVFHSFGDVVRHDPARIVREYPGFVWESVKNVHLMSVVGPGVVFLGLLGLGLAIRRHPLLAIVAVLHLLLVSLTHWETRYYFLVMVILAGAAVYAVAWLCRRWHPAVPVAIVTLLCVWSATQSVSYVRRLLASHPVEVPAACGSFHGSILARKPHLGAICHERWVFFPAVRSVEELHVWLRAHPVDYVAYGIPEAMARRELLPLADPRRAPPWLRPVWFSAKPRLVIYKVSGAPSAPGR